MRRGRFIVIEGTDGSGKTVQFKKLVAWLRRTGYLVVTVDFPRYGMPSAFFAEKYLRGEYGNWRSCGPRAASLFYALDRFDATPEIRKALASGKTVVANRYVASNMGHQGAKIGSLADRRKFMRWLHEFEYGIFGIPKPDLNIVLRVPPEIAFRLVGRKGAREYLQGKKRDVHEADIGHLRDAAAAYATAIQLFQREFCVIQCAPKGILLTREAVHAKVRAVVQGLLKRKDLRAHPLQK